MKKINNKNWEFVNLHELKLLGKNTHESFHKHAVEEISRSAAFINNKSIDVAKFYDSIYTHSLEWIGDQEIKKISKDIDNLIKNINGRVSNGIPTGPIPSKIVAEIILTSVMLEVDEKVKDLDVHIHRYSDDFTIYYNSEDVFLKTVKEIASILGKYKLNINKEKYDNNYTYKNISFKKINMYEQEGEWDILLDEMKMIERNEKSAINRIEKIIVNTIRSIADQKSKSSFYKWILKTWNKDKYLETIKKNESNLKEIFLNFAINYIVITDLSLNIPFFFLERILKEDDLNRNKKNYIEKLNDLYFKTESEIKKIFIFDFLHSNQWFDTNKFKKLNEKYKPDHLLHLSQLLEAKIIDFESIKDIEKPTSKHKRLSKEWVIWLYADEESLKGVKEMEHFVEFKDFYKPFSY